MYFSNRALIHCRNKLEVWSDWSVLKEGGGVLTDICYRSNRGLASSERKVRLASQSHRFDSCGIMTARLCVLPFVVQFSGVLCATAFVLVVRINTKVISV
jgi:hypothetical protein